MSLADSLAIRVREFEEKNELLREEKARLTAIFSEGPPIPLEWGLTGQQRRILAVLSKLDVAATDRLMDALYFDRADEGGNLNVLRAQITRLRAKLKPYGYKIRNIHGVGYAMIHIAPVGRAA